MPIIINLKPAKTKEQKERNLNSALKILKKKTRPLFKEMRIRQYFEKPSDKIRRKRNEKKHKKKNKKK